MLWGWQPQRCHSKRSPAVWSAGPWSFPRSFPGQFSVAVLGQRAPESDYCCSRCFRNNLHPHLFLFAGVSNFLGFTKQNQCTRHFLNLRFFLDPQFVQRRRTPCGTAFGSLSLRRHLVFIVCTKIMQKKSNPEVGFFRLEHSDPPVWEPQVYIIAIFRSGGDMVVVRL